MTAVSNQVTVGTSAVVVVPAPPNPTSNAPVVISNGAAVIFVGGPNVTTGTGMPVPVNAVVNLGPLGNSPLYAICATSSVVGYLTTQ